jgi:hypothetical protein
MSDWITKKPEEKTESKWIQKKKVNEPQNWITKKEEKKNYITKKDSAQTSGKETVSDAQKRGKIPLNFNKGGRVNLKDGGCAQIKGFGKARRPKKKKYA